MIQNLMIAAIVKAIQAMLCQMYGICVNSEECPDGVCDEALESIDSISHYLDEPTAKPTTQALDIDLQFDELPALVEATKQFITALMCFIGKCPRVGG